MRPFDLLEALAGGKVVTRNGEEAILISFVISELYPLKGAIIGMNTRMVCWSSEGCYSIMTDCSPHDLFMKED